MAKPLETAEQVYEALSAFLVQSNEEGSDDPVWTCEECDEPRCRVADGKCFDCWWGIQDA